MQKRVFDLPAKVARKIEQPKSGRRVRAGLDKSGRKHLTDAGDVLVLPPVRRSQYDTTGTKGRHSESRPPPRKEGLPEYQVIHELPTAKGRAFRLWSKTEIK
jgi:hypothetical protein